MIELNDVSVIYDQKIIALNHLTMTIGDGITMIIGENGSGKSSLLESLVGIIKPAGTITINNMILNEENLTEIRNKVGMIFQNPDHQLFMNTVYDDIAFGLINQGINPKEIAIKVDSIAKRLGIENLLNRSSTKLSGGQKRMVAIATVLVMEPEVILFDEPTSFLDMKARRQIINVIKELHKSCVIVTHDLEMAIELSDDVILLNNGKCIAQGSAKDVFSNKELLLENGLEVPYSMR